MFLKVYKFKILMAMLFVPFLAFAQPPSGWEIPTPLSFQTHNIIVPDGIVLDVNGTTVEDGDWLGVFYYDGADFVCGGHVQMGDPNSPNNNITAYGDAGGTFPGFSMGEAFTWKFYDASDDMEYFTQAEYLEGPGAGNFSGGASTLDGFVQAFVISASADPSMIDAGQDVDLSAVNLDPANYNVVDWEWDDGMGNTYSGQNVTVFVDQTTTFTVTATTDGNLTATATATVTMSMVSAGADAEVCEDPGTYVLADAVVSGDFFSYGWATSGDGVFDDPGAMNPTYTAGAQDIADGMVTLTLTAVGPNGPVSDDIMLTFAAPATVDIIPDDIYLCATENTILDVADFTDLVDITGNYANLQWSPINAAGTFSDENVPEPTYFPSLIDLAQFDNDGTPTILQIQVFSADPCEIDGVDQVDLRYVRAPEVVDAGMEAGYCIEPGLMSHTFADAEVVFGDNPWVPEAINTIMWTTDGTGTFDDPTIANPTYFFGPDDMETGTINFTLTAETEQACGPVTSETSITLQAPPEAYAGPDATICEDGVFEFTESYANNYSLIQWSGINGTGDFSDENIEQPTYTPSFQDILQGCVTLQIEASAIDPCVGGASDQMELCFQLNPTIDMVEYDTICANESYTPDPIVENSNGVYMWTVDGGFGELLNPDQLQPTYVAANPEDVGQNVYLTLNAGPIDPCTVSAEATVELHILCAPNVYAGEDFTVCETENPQLVGTAECVSETMWATTGDGYFCCPDDLETTYYPGPMDKEGCVTLVLIGYPEAPCELYELDKVVVCFDPAPVVDAGPDLTVCEGESIQLDGTTTDVCGIQWFAYNGNGTFDDETIEDPVYTPNGQDLIAGTVQLVITGAPCGTCTEPAMDTMNLTIQPLPVVEIEEDEVTICEDQVLNTADLDILVENQANVVWSTAGDGVFGNPAVIETTYTPGADDIANTLTVLTLTGAPIDPCSTSESDDVILNIQHLPSVNILPDDTTICETDVFDFAGLVEASDYTAIQWANVNGSGDIVTETDLEPIYYPGFVELEQGFVELCINVSPVGPCIGPGATDCITIYFQEEVNIEIPQSAVICEDATFTPDTYVIENNCGVLWETTGDGTFDDPTLEYPVYTPGPTDIANEGVTLTLTGEGCSTCDDLTVEIVLLIQLNPTADAGEDGVVCEMLCAPPWSNGIYEDLMGSVTNASSFMWTTDGDGMFVPGADVLDPDYVLGDGDIADPDMQVELCLTAEPIDPCTVSATDCMILEIQPFPVADAGPDQEICEGDDAQLDGETEYASGVFWDFALYGEGDGSFSNQIIEDPVYTPGPEDIERGYVELIMVAFPISPCTYPDADNMTVNIIPQPISDAGEDATICEGETLQLDGSVENASGGYEWTTSGDGFFDPATDILNPLYVPGPDDIAAGTVELCLYAFDGTACQADYFDCLTLTILPPPEAFAGDDAVICEGDSYQIADATANNYSSVVWSGGAGSFDDNTLVNPTYTPDASEYGTTVTLCMEVMPTDPCTASVTDCMDLLINEAPAIGFCFNGDLAETGSMFEFCYDETVTVSVCEVWAGTGPFDICYSLNGEPEVCVTDVAELGDVFSGVLPVGEHSVQITSITDANGCTALDVTPYIAYVTVNPEPDANFCVEGQVAGYGDEFTFCYDEVVTVDLCEILSGEGPFDIEYTLNGDSFTGTYNEGDVIYDATLPVGQNVIELVSMVDANGCVLADPSLYTMTININPEPDANFCVNGEVAGYGDVFEFCYDETVVVDMCEILSGTGPFEVCWTLDGGAVECATVDEGGELFNGMLEVGTHDIVLTSITDANGCVLADPSLYTMTIIINPEPDVDFCVNGDPVGYGDTFEFCWTEMIDVTICETLSGEGPFEVCWTLNGGPVECATVAEGGSLFNDMLPLGEHVVELVSLTDANGCVLADPSLYVMNFNIVEPAALFCFNGETASTGSVFEYCYDEEVVVTLCEDLTGTGPYDIEWTVNGDAFSATEVEVGDVLFQDLLDAGTYVVEITSLIDATGCPASDPSIYTATVIVHPEPFITFAVNGNQVAPGYIEEFCYDETITVSLFDIWTGTAPFEVCYEVYKDGDLFIENCVMVENPGDVLESGMYEPGTYELMVTSLTDAEGCMASQATLAQYTGTIIVNEEPDVDFCVNQVPAGYGDVFTFCYDEVIDVTLCEVLSGEGPFEVCYQLNAEPEVCVTIEAGESIFNGTLAVGNHTVQLTSLTDANGCMLADPSLYNMEFVINPEPDANFCVNGVVSGYGDTFNFCEGDNIVVDMCEILSGTGPFEICYTLDGGDVECATVDEGGELFNGTLEPGTHEIVLVSMTDANGCVLADPSLYTMSIFIQDAPFVDAGDDLETCEESPVAITGFAENASSVMWSGGLGTFDPVDNVETTYTPAAGETGVVELCLTAQPIDPCTVEAVDCMELTIVPAPTVDVGPDLSECDNVQSVALSADVANYSTLLWSVDPALGFIDTPNEPNANFFPSPEALANGAEICLEAQPINPPCSDSVVDCLEITFIPSPQAFAGDDATICEGDTEFPLDDAFASNYDGLMWTTSGDGTFSDVAALNPTYYPGMDDVVNGGAELCLEAMPLAGCDTPDVSCLDLTIIPNPVIEPAPPIELGCDLYDFVDLEWLPIPLNPDVTGGVTFQWSTDGDGVFADPTAQNTTYELGPEFDKWNGMVTLTLTVQGAGGCGVEAVQDFIIYVPQQIIDIADGVYWRGISSYVDKETTSVAEVMDPVVVVPGSQSLVIMIDKQGTSFWPEPIPPINNLGNWEPIGYQAKFKAEGCLPIYGDEPYDTTAHTFFIDGSFTYLPVLTNQEVVLNDFFADHLDDILLIYDWYTGDLWTPGPEVDPLETIKPGFAYLMVNKLGFTPYEITFPDIDLDGSIVTAPGEPIALTDNSGPWNEVVNTAKPHFIMFADEVMSQIQPGDVIGAFNQYNECVGVAELENRDDMLRLLAMGDDPVSEEIEGFEVGEYMNFKLYRSSTGETFDVSFTYDPEYPSYNNEFTVYGVSKVVDLTMNATALGEGLSSNSISVFPNPATDVINIVSDYNIKSVTLVNYVGQVVYTNDVNGSDFQINVSSYVTGMYVLNIETTEGNVITKRISVE